MPHVPATVLVILAAVLWGTIGTAQELGPEGIDPLAVGWARLVVGAAGLVAVARLRRARRDRLSRLWLLVAIGAVASFQLTFFGGVRLAGVALGTAVGIGSAPIFGGLVDAVVVGWRPKIRWVGAAGVSVVGVALVAGEPGGGENPGVGLALALMAGLSYATYSMALQRLALEADADHVASTVFCGAALVLTPVLLFADVSPLFTGRGAVMTAHLGLAATTLAYVLFTRGVRDTPVSTAMLLSMTEPLTAVILGVTLVGETLTTTAIVGVLVLLVSVSLATTVPGRRKAAAPA